METWLRRRLCHFFLPHMQNNDIFTAGACCCFSKCLRYHRVSRHLFVGGFSCPQVLGNGGGGVCVLAGLHVCYLSALSWQVEKKMFSKSLALLRYTTTMNNPLKAPLS